MFGEQCALLLREKLLDGDQQRRIAHESRLPVDHLGEFVQRLERCRVSNALSACAIALDIGLSSRSCP